MAKNDHVQVGKSASAHHGTGRAPQAHVGSRSSASHGVGARSGNRTAASRGMGVHVGSTAAAPHPLFANGAGKRFSATGHVDHAESFSMRGRGPHRAPNGKVVLVALACIAVVALAGGWFLFWRDVTLTVNGAAVTVRVGTPLSEVLDENDQFGAVPGRLLSVGGNVISDDGGSASTVSRDGEELTQDQVDRTRVQDGDEFTVANGADVEEASKEETVAAAPGIQKESGGAIQYVSQWGKAGKKRVKVGETSGETVDVEVLQEPQDMVIASVNPKPHGGNYVALTFDDGPSKYTPQILEILKEKGAKATFFNLGQQAQDNPAGSKAIVDAGMELASHTMAHQNLPKADRDTLRSEISNAASALKDATGEDTQMIRAPYGAFTDVEWARSGDLISCNVLWNIDTLDWKRPGASAIQAAALKGVHNGSIILMHDGGGNREQTVQALPGIIDSLRSQGYELVTVSELMKLDGNIPKDVVNGTVSMPDDATLPDA